MIKSLLKFFFKNELRDLEDEAAEYGHRRRRHISRGKRFEVTSTPEETEFALRSGVFFGDQSTENLVQGYRSPTPNYHVPPISGQKGWVSKVFSCSKCDYAGHLFDLQDWRVCRYCGDGTTDRTGRWNSELKRWELK